MWAVVVEMAHFVGYLACVLSMIAVVFGLGLLLAHIHEVAQKRMGRERLAAMKREVK